VNPPGIRRQSIMASAIVLLSMVAVALFPAQATADDQASRDDVFTALHVAQMPADYVILVDTSGSMESGNLYAGVKSALSPLLQSLSPDDHLSLLTFDAVPAIRYSGPVGSAGDHALAQLPERATGKGTDIGAAIEAGIRELERPDALQVGTLILLTDGQHEPAAGTSYPGRNGGAWDTLASRGKALSERHAINSFALALRPDTDASLLQQAFAQTTIAALPQDQVGSYFVGLRDQVKSLKARALLAADHLTLTATWSGLLKDLSYDTGAADATLTITSGSTHVPLVVSGIRVSGTGARIQASVDQRSVLINPNEKKNVKVRVSFEHESGFQLGREKVTDHGTLTVRGDISSPWSDVLTRDLNLPFKPALNTKPARVVITGEYGLGFALLALCLAGLLAAVVIVRALVVARQPRLRGAISVLNGGEPVEDEVHLSGRRLRFGKGPLRPFKTLLRGDVRAVRRRSDLDRQLEYGVRITARTGSSRRTTTLWGGDQLNVDQVQISYHV
jgi:VWA domain-containing protein